MKFMNFKPASQFGCVSGAMAESTREKFLKTTPLPSNVIGLALPQSVPQRCGKRDASVTPFRPCCCLATSSSGVWQWSRAPEWRLPEDCDQKLCFPTMIGCNLWPELVLCSASIRQVYIMKLIVPWESSLEEAKKPRAWGLLLVCNNKAERRGRGLEATSKSSPKSWEREGRPTGKDLCSVSA